MTQLRLGYDLVGSWINESWMQGNNTTCVTFHWSICISVADDLASFTYHSNHTAWTNKTNVQPITSKHTTTANHVKAADVSQSRQSAQWQPIMSKHPMTANHVKAHSDSQSCQSTQWQPITTKHTTTANHTKAAYDSTQWQPITSKHPMTANHVKALYDSKSRQSTQRQQITSKHITAANH